MRGSRTPGLSGFRGLLPVSARKRAASFIPSRVTFVLHSRATGRRQARLRTTYPSCWSAGAGAGGSKSTSSRLGGNSPHVKSRV